MSQKSHTRRKYLAEQASKVENARNSKSFEKSVNYDLSDTLIEFDEVYAVTVPSVLVNRPDAYKKFMHRSKKILQRGLGDRINLLHINHTNLEAVASKKPTAPDSSSPVIYIGILVNSNAANRLLDHGPTVEEQKEAEDFRQFWGERSELRRFKDGRITETLVWSNSSPVTHQIIQYLLAFHFQLASDAVTRISQDIDTDQFQSDEAVSSTDAFKIIHTKYQELTSTLHQLSGLPLSIRAISPCSSNLRSATLGSPLSLRTSIPTDIVVQFDSSTRWPDHLPAIQYTKIAFLTKLSDLLLEGNSSWNTRLGIENTHSSGMGILNTSFLDIIQPSPAPGLAPVAFRVRIYHDRELHLIQAQLSSKTLSSSIREQFSDALVEHKRNFVAAPLHTTTIRNLVNHFPPLSSTISTLKSWVASHHLSNHVPEPALEIIAAHVFLHPAPWSVPGTTSTAFIRCLHFLAHWEWAIKPLIVDLSLTQDLAATAYTDLETRFQAWRKLDPAMNNIAWFIGTNIDNTGTVWTQKSRPARVVASRLTALARAAIELIKAHGVSIQKADWVNLFTSGLEDFDFVIYLKHSVVRGYRHQGKRRGNELRFKNIALQEELDVDSSGHDVVEVFLEDLERVFASSVLFFHGARQPVIGGLWRPSVMAAREWRVRLGFSSMPVVGSRKDDSAKTETMCQINQEGILHEIAGMGIGIIEKIVPKQ